MCTYYLILRLRKNLLVHAFQRPQTLFTHQPLSWLLDARPVNNSRPDQNCWTRVGSSSQMRASVLHWFTILCNTVDWLMVKKSSFHQLIISLSLHTGLYKYIPGGDRRMSSIDSVTQWLQKISKAHLQRWPKLTSQQSTGQPNWLRDFK